MAANMQPTLLECGHYIATPERIGGVCQICGKTCCSQCLQTCMNCGRKVCPEHQKWKENRTLVYCLKCNPGYYARRLLRGLGRMFLPGDS